MIYNRIICIDRHLIKTSDIVELKFFSLDTDYYLSQFFANIQIQAPGFEAVVSLLCALILLFVSGFISASEIAFFSLGPIDLNRIQEEETTTDSKIQQLLDNTQKLLATILIANNFVNVAVVMLMTFFMNSLFANQSPVFSFVIQTVLLTFLLLLIGAIMPKIYSSYNPLKFARRSASTIAVLQKVFSPLSGLLVWGTTKLNKHLPSSNSNISIDDLSQVLELTSHEIKDEKKMLEDIIKFGDKSAQEIMTSRVEMVAIEMNRNFREIIDLIVETNYSRIPVFENTEDSIKGILYIKDLLPYINQKEDFAWQTVIRPAYYVPQTKMIDDLLEDFRSKKIHMAIVVDEFGGTSGLVTLEDVLEEIVGEIRDEYDEEELRFKKINDNTWIFEGKILLNDFYKITSLTEEEFLPESEDCETLAGLLLEIKADFPKLHETMEYKGYRFTVIEIDARRILKVKFTITDQVAKVS